MGEEKREELRVSMRDVVRFLRQLSHDIRNHLNAAELQAAFIGEIADDDEVKLEIKRLRGMVGEAAIALQRLSATITEVKLNRIEYDASELVEDLQQKLTQRFAEKADEVAWQINLKKGATLNIDPQLLEQSVTELFDNAFRHSRNAAKIEATAAIDGRDFVLKLSEPKDNFDCPTNSWGLEPFSSVSHGHYGLGLHRARSIVEAHNGQMTAEYDPASSNLVTTIRLPLVVRRG